MNLLVANRGEIAVRICRTARDLGHHTIAVYSEADADAPHVRAADAAVPIGPSAPKESYLSIAKIIDAAKRMDADAIHPGYGFLSENADFAEACVDAGIVFVGPPADVIRLMGDKAAAKQRMAEAGVPLLEGYNGVDQGDAKLASEAERIGFPLMVKAAAGGGGKGMRLVRDAAGLAEALAAARREAAGAFGSTKLILERALLAPRHVEIQILADMHGKVVALGERDCSVQRRHQKVVEEAPSPALDRTLRDRMSAAAIRAAADIGYVGAGTVEFLVDEDGTFAFLEMNTRLQVEHPVTEMTTGIDLVAWQLRIAAGEHLTIEQRDVHLEGHAIEVRLYAEGPEYMPSIGRIEAWLPPSGAGIRVDAGVEAGVYVSANYDPMLAKIIAHGATREEARRRLIMALERTIVLGIATNRAALIGILRDPRFASGHFSTAFLQDLQPPVETAAPAHLASIGMRLHEERKKIVLRRSPDLAGWSNNASRETPMRLALDDVVHDVRLSETRDGHMVTVDGVTIDALPSPTAFRMDGTRVLASFPSFDVDAVDVSLAPPEPASSAGSGVIHAPFHGRISVNFADVGARVQAGDKLIAIEAMKMEHALIADIAGILVSIANAGAQVAAGEVLARIEADQDNV